MHSFYMDYDVMPHTEETKIVLEGLIFDDDTLEDYEHFLRTMPTKAIYHKGHFCGFAIEWEQDEDIEVHCYIYPSQRRMARLYMLSVLEKAKSKGKYISTKVFSNYSYIARFLEMNGFKRVGVDVGAAVKNGEPIDFIHLNNEETLYGWRRR